MLTQMVRDVDNTFSSRFDSDSILVFDLETSTFNTGNPFDPRNFGVSYAYHWNNSINFKYYNDPDFRSSILECLGSCNILVGFNIKFDIHWLTNMGINIPSHVKIWDCQIAEFINSGQRLSYDSLDNACDRYGLPRKPDRIKQYWEAGISTEHIPIKELEEYNIHDVESTLGIYNIQRSLLEPKQQALVLLEGEDLKTLQAAEYAGIKYNKQGATKLIEKSTSETDVLVSKLLSYLPDGVPDGCFNINSGDHLSALLYGGTINFDVATTTTEAYKSGSKKGTSYERRRWSVVPVNFVQRFVPIEGTEVKKTKDDPEAITRFYQVEQPTLLQLKAKSKEDEELLDLLKALADSAKVAEMAQSIINKMTEMNWQGDYIHGQFNQVVARTGRLSSSAPNLQNTPLDIDRLLVSRYA